jgi:di/tricarboxylate transporter
MMTDVTLASGIPSITARSGGIVLPITRSLAELYESRPGPTARRLGQFLMAVISQGSAVACAMFLTGQASNVLAVGLAAQYAHYAFASITAHLLAMFPPFVIMLIALGTPPTLAVYALACLANLTSGLTHYGRTTAPIFFLKATCRRPTGGALASRCRW